MLPGDIRNLQDARECATVLYTTTLDIMDALASVPGQHRNRVYTFVILRAVISLLGHLRSDYRDALARQEKKAS
jgi:hypothetical protein